MSNLKKSRTLRKQTKRRRTDKIEETKKKDREQIRTWSVPSHIPLPPLYLRCIAPNGVQQPKLPKAQSQGLCQLLWLKGWPWSDWLLIMESGSDFLRWTWHGSQGELRTNNKEEQTKEEDEEEEQTKIRRTEQNKHKKGKKKNLCVSLC